MFDVNILTLCASRVQFIQTFAMNPQFHVEVTVPDANEKEGLLVVGLMQKDDRKKRRDTGADLLSIGYMIYEGTAAKGVLDKRYFETHRSVAKTEYVSASEYLSLSLSLSRLSCESNSCRAVPQVHQPARGDRTPQAQAGRLRDRAEHLRGGR